MPTTEGSPVVPPVPPADPSPDLEPSSPDAPAIDGLITLADVEVGDVILTARPGFLQDLCTRAGEPWRHVGLAVDSPGGTGIAEVAGISFRVRSLADVAATAEAISVARLPTGYRPAGRRAARWCADRCDDRSGGQVYAWDDLILAGFISATRLYCPLRYETELASGVRAATEHLRRERDDPTVERFTCSSFVAAALANAGIPLATDLLRPRSPGRHPPVSDLLRRRPRPVRSGHGSRIDGDQAVSTLRALIAGVTAAPLRHSDDGPVPSWIRWITPGDIWRAPTFTQRFQVSLPEGPPIRCSSLRPHSERRGRKDPGRVGNRTHWFNWQRSVRSAATLTAKGRRRSRPVRPDPPSE